MVTTPGNRTPPSSPSFRDKSSKPPDGLNGRGPHAGPLPDIDEHKVSVTFLTNEFARFQEQESLTLPELGERILATVKSSKEKLPFMKLATFGTLRSDRDCLRWDKNVKTISGTGHDYDDEKVSLEEGLAILRSAGIRGLVCTTASHTVEAPRWRLYLPLSKELVPPDGEADPVGWLKVQHATLVRKVNSLFNNIFAPESEVLSQAYYYGSIRGKDPIRVEVIDGAFVDTMTLPEVPEVRKPTGQDKSFKTTEPADPDEVERALSVIPAESYKTWREVGAGLFNEFGEDGFDLFETWSKKSSKYDADKVRRKWEACQAFTKFTIGTVFWYADQASPGYDQETLRQAYDANNNNPSLLDAEKERPQEPTEPDGPVEERTSRAEQIAKNVEIGNDTAEPGLPTIMTLQEMTQRLVFIGSVSAVADRETGRVRKKENAAAAR